MKSLIIICSVLFFKISVSQNVDTTRRFMIVDAKEVIGHLLYIVDGKKLNHLRKGIIKKIAFVYVLKDSTNVAKYGTVAANGIVYILTKQHKESHTDLLVNAKPFNSTVSENAIYLVDGEVSPNKLTKIDPGNISSITILKQLNHISDFIDETIIVVTKSYAISEYQKKFITLSKEYKEYLENHDHSDRDVAYIENGTYISAKDSSELIVKLYALSKKPIEYFHFGENPFMNGNKSAKYFVVVTTKKDN